MKIKLNKKEAEILKEALSNVNYRFDFLNFHEKEQLCLPISKNQADEIRDICAEYLQVVGFDENYCPTEKGKLLESLIDKFFIG